MQSKRPRTAFLFETESIIISASVAIRRTGCKREGVLARQHRSKSNFSHMVFPFIHAAKNLNRVIMVADRNLAQFFFEVLVAAWENDTLRGNFLARFVRQLQPTNKQKTSCWKRRLPEFYLLSLGTALL